VKSKTHLIITKGFVTPSRKLPSFCRKNGLQSRCSIQWRWTNPMEEEAFTLIKRLLKLFPFELLRIEVDKGRSRDVFSDWDSYVEWAKAENLSLERLFSRIQILRHKKVLGFLVWTKRSDSSGLDLNIYTEHDQTRPISQACETIATVEIGVNPARSTQKKSCFYEWALSFFNSSVKRGTTSKRSATIP